jgi:hypothetical protein
MDLFGFEIKRKKEEELASFAPPLREDGAIVVESFGSSSVYLDVEGGIANEATLIDRYRDMASYPQVSNAIDDIINEVIVQEPEEKVVELILDELEQPDTIKNKIVDEFDNILRLLNFNQEGYDIAKRWYVDGRLLYHAIINEKASMEGIKELRYIDPRKIKKIVEIKRNSNNISADPKQELEYYIYNDKGFTTSTNTSGNNNTTSGLKIAKDSIIHVTSGEMSPDATMVHSFLHNAIRPLNMLRQMEDALLIYTISRAPERRVFYIDVGDTPPAKAHQALTEIQNKYKNRVVFNNQTGEIGNDKKHMTMLEDFWLLRQGTKNTEISSLPGGTSLFSSLEGIDYFSKKLNDSLHVPESRLDSGSLFSSGQEGTVSREEIKFAKFIERLRQKFSNLFLTILEKQLILKNIINPEDWEEFKNLIKFKYAVDNYYAEQKEMFILNGRLAALDVASPYVGKYFSNEELRRNILKQSDEDMSRNDEQIKKEKSTEQYTPPIPDMNGFGGDSFNNTPQYNNGFPDNSQQQNQIEPIGMTQNPLKQ